MGKLSLLRIYDKEQPATGYRILVDRLWHVALKRSERELICGVRRLHRAPSYVSGLIMRTINILPSKKSILLS